ncbi:MAG: Omp28-related outer membrane protein [Saprospiraceae bacterium]
MKTSLTILAIFLSIQVAFCQQVNTKNWVLIHERTADWCPFCGTWGWDMKTQALSKFANENVIFMAVHHSGGLNNTTATELGANFPGAGQPIFYVDGFDIQVNSSNISSKLNDTQLEIDFKKSVPALAGVGIDAQLSTSTNTLTVKAKVEFLSAVEGGDYYLGLYLLEDVMNVQASRSGQQLHKNVLRRSLLPTTFGNALKAGAIAKGTTFDVTASVANITANRENIKVVGIIWSKSNGRYLFFNANQVNVSIPADNNELALSENIRVYQSANNLIDIELDTDQFKANTIVHITDISGKNIVAQSVSQNDISGNKISISGNFAKGMHIVTLTSGKVSVSKKVMIY